MRYARVLVYVPLHPDTRELVARYQGRVVHREAVAAAPPSLTIIETDRVGVDRVRVRWAGEHENPLVYDLDYILAGRALLALGRDLRDTEYEAELASYPGSEEARIGVLATDGTRSAWALSEPFAVAGGPPYAWIQSPGSPVPGPIRSASQPGRRGLRRRRPAPA